MTYDPAIPQPTDNISVSQGDILDNFAQIGLLFGSNATADHYAFNDGTAALRGLHKRVSFKVPLLADPAVAAPESYLYTKAASNDTATKTQLYFENDLGVTQLTNKFTSLVTNNGYIILPSGLIIMWGFKSGNPFVSNTVAVTFPTITGYTGGGYAAGFPTACFQVQLTGQIGDNTAKTCSIQDSSITAIGFTIRISSLAITNVYWFAIGN